MKMEQKINKLIRYIFFTVCFYFSVNTDISATHIVGGNLTYKHVAGDIYQVRLVLRRDCFLGSPEAQFDDPAAIGVFTSSGALAIWIGNNGQIKIPFMSSDTLNEYIRSDCGFEGTQVCVHETTYQANIALPNRPGGYILAYQRCCRNASLNNVIDPLETGTTYWVAITEKSLTLKNSSPVFEQWPDVYICTNKPLVFDHSASDRDGDSLVYKLCVPSVGATRINPKPQPPGFPPYTNIQWAPPYSLNDMMGGVPLKIDSKTGVITATPNLVGQFLIGVCVEEYRKGELLSVVRRDFQYNVRVCSQPPLAQFTTSEFKCDGLKVDFYNNSLSSSAYQWDFNYPSTDPIFKSTEKNPVYTFPAPGIYTVRLRATRGSDGCFDTLLQQVAVFENKIVPEFTYALSGCTESSDSLSIFLSDLSAFNEPGYVLNNWQWMVDQNGNTVIYNGKNVDIDISNNGNVNITLNVFGSNGCSSKMSRMLNVDDFIPELQFDYKLLGCPSDSIAEIRLTNLSGPLNPYATLDSSKWTIGNQVYTGDSVNVRLPQNTTSFTVNLQTSFYSNCRVDLSKTFDLSDFTPNTAYGYNPVECTSDSTVTIALQYVDTLSNNTEVTGINWNGGTAGNPNDYTGNNIEITLPKDSLLSFTMTTTFANGCIDRLSDTFLPGPFATLQFVAGPILLCPGDAKQIITNANPDWTYTWSPTAGLDLSDPANPKVVSDSNRTYQVTVTDGLCTVSGKVDVIALSGGVLLDIDADTVTCDGKVSLNVAGGVGPGTYFWGTNPGVNPVIGTGTSLQTSFNGPEQIYYVRFSGERCSSEPATIKITNQLPSIDDLSPVVLCRQDTVQVITLNQIPGHQNTFVWNNDSHIISGANTSSPTITVGPNENQPFVLRYTVTNQFGCILKDSVEVLINENPVIDFNFSLTSCGEYQICFNTSGTYNGFIKWDFGDPTTSSDISIEKTPCYTYGDGGTYDVRLTNLIGTCPFKDVVKQVVVNPQIRLKNLRDTILCKGDSISFKATSNLQNVEYGWYNINGVLLNPGPDFAGAFDQNTQLIIRGKDIYGCTDADTVAVDYFRFQFSVNVKDSLCVDEPSSISLNITDPASYNILWSPAECIVSGANSANPVILPQSGKTIFVNLVHKATGCRDSSQVQPKVTQPFDFNINTSDVLCLDVPTTVSLLIDDPERYLYQWKPESFITSGANTVNPVINLSEDQVFTVLVTNRLSGCKKSKDILVKVGDAVNVDVNAEPDLTIYEGETVDIVVTDPIPNASYIWSTGETTLTIKVNPVVTTSYQVTVTDSNGCTAIDEVTVTVRNARCDETDIFIPNAFSPNNDGNNDIFRVRSNFIDELEMLVYNRWGQEVFRTTSLNGGWDGTFNGTELAPDVFAYYIRVLCINGEEYKKKGNVSLLR